MLNHSYKFNYNKSSLKYKKKMEFPGKGWHGRAKGWHGRATFNSESRMTRTKRALGRASDAGGGNAFSSVKSRF
jgi:hypothetical protein